MFCNIIDQWKCNNLIYKSWTMLEVSKISNFDTWWTEFEPDSNID